MENFFLFVLMCVLLILLPGPDFAIVTKNTVTRGKFGGMKTALGTCCALLIHTTAAILGLSALIVKSAFLFSIFKYVGAIYLIYLGIKTFWSLRKKKDEVEVEFVQEGTLSNTSCFKQGFLTNILNPKVALFFLTFFPQFVNTSSDTFMPFLIMGITYTILTALWFIFYIYLIDHISAFIKNARTQKVIEGITGAILIGFGLRLALEKANP
ncbi:MULTISPECIES: LysE family translocator [Ureibacillus]|uniref:RhtB (Resistance to homoserine/threonine) family protein n=1 Tax=Ureibacillus thermosphaericus TaxID=51173 RepID=A0A840PWS3_URETH|nr:LysE family translocator [Ureibacillus thermosphaericus]MBB5150320.1 RhtB (resistance to homoserine/threonine) family protein [Ureibacillus thermosphaericus]NKZ32913.1 LysE family translocator [Ureibacillus thermosphaericus]